MELEEKYNLLIIGGGPGAVKFLYNLFRTSKLPEYLNGLGIGIIEKGKCFGSGNLENKVTYATYPANELIKLMYFHKTNQMISICKDLVDTQAYKTLTQYGDKNPPKSLAGFFLRLLGNVLLKHIYTLKKQQIFHPHREVIGIRLLADGWFQIRTQNLDAQIKDKYRSVKAKHIILCTGREQLPSDIFCQEQGLIETLRQVPRHILGNGQKAFECADLLINGPVMYMNNEPINAFTQKIYTCLLCKSLKCTCFGSLVPLKYVWHYSDVVLPEFQKGELKIHIIKPPRPYFSNYKNDYITIPQEQTNKFGEANYLTGLRGRSKNLFLRLMAAQENKIQLTQEQPKNQFIDANECKCVQIEVKDTDGNIIEFQQTFGLYQLDDKGRMKTQKGSLRNLFCYGSNCITAQQLEKGCVEEYGDCSLSFEDLELFFPNIKGDINNQWFDNNDFPLTAQSNVLSKGGDFDSDPSVHSEVVETETFALNQLQQQLVQKKKKK